MVLLEPIGVTHVMGVVYPLSSQPTPLLSGGRISLNDLPTSQGGHSIISAGNTTLLTH